MVASLTCLILLGSASIARAQITNAAGTNFSAVEGQAFSYATVATFDSTDSPATCFTATIGWGDGSTTAGTVLNTGAGTWSVTGGHTFAEEGTEGTAIAITDNCTKPASQSPATGSATVSDAALTSHPTAFAAASGESFSGQVTTFTDADPSGAASDYTATINWGDGSSSGGSVSSLGNGVFAVDGGHTYGSGGSYTVAVTVGDAGGASTTSTETVQVTSSSIPLAVLTASSSTPAAGQMVTFSGARTIARCGTVTSYDWSFDGSGTFSTSTGSNPVAHWSFRPGTHTVEMRAANSCHQSATATTTLSVTGVSRSVPAANRQLGTNCAEFPYSTISLGLVLITADAPCIAPSRDRSGYVFAASELNFNGTDLVTEDGRPHQFVLSTTRSGDFLTGPPVQVKLLNTPIGDLVLGTLDLTHRPLALTGAAHHRGRGDVLVGTFGVATHCPTQPNTACAQVPGGFPLTGMVTLYLDDRAEMLVDVNVALNLRQYGFSVTGALTIVSDHDTGIHLTSLQFGPFSANLSYFQIRNAEFRYYWPDYVDPRTGSSALADSWDARATISVENEVTVGGSLQFIHGQFAEGSLLLSLPAGEGIPIYAGVLLNRFGGSIRVIPRLEFTGLLGASIEQVFELTLHFNYAGATATQLGHYGGGGTLDFEGHQVATLNGEVWSDGFFAAALTLDLHYPLDAANDSASYVYINGGLSYWDDPASRAYEASGSFRFGLFTFINGQAQGVIVPNLDAGCLAMTVTNPFTGQQVRVGSLYGWYRPSDGAWSGSASTDSNCDDLIGQYRVHPLAPHCAPGSGCISAGLANDVLALRAGAFAQSLLIRAAGTPVVKVTSPDGKLSFTTPSQPGHWIGEPGVFLAGLGPHPGELTVVLEHPAGGRWRLDPAPGAPPISQVQLAAETPPPGIHAIVLQARGRSRRLAYRIANWMPGTRVRFVEHGRDSTHVIGIASRARGVLIFTPADALGRRRTIDADVLNLDGTPKLPATVAHYIAPPPIRGGRPGKLRLVRRRTNVVLSWGPADGTRRYVVTVKVSDGRLGQFLLPASARHLTISRVLAFETVRAAVLAEGGLNFLPGQTQAVTLRGTRLRPARPPLHPRRLRRLPGLLLS